MFLCFLELASIFFLLARFGRKTDGHILNMRMFFKFFMCFFCIKGLRPHAYFGAKTWIFEGWLLFFDLH